MNKRTQTDQGKGTEATILRETLEAFEEVTALPVVAVKQHARLPEGRADAIVTLPGGKQFVIEIKKTLTPATLGQAVAQMARFKKKKGMLVTRHVTVPMAERLRTLDIAFMDTAGNAYLKLPNIFVYVTGRKPKIVQPREKRLRAFRPTGLKVIFALLCRPVLVTAPYREIANAADVALGAVAWTLNDLKKVGHLRETKVGRKIEERDRLIDAWVEGYTRELRPKLKPRRFRVANADWWKKEDLTRFDMWLAGEPAAAIMTKYLRPEVITVYGDTHFAELALKIRAVKDEYGNFELLQKFWHFEVPQQKTRYPLVPPLLVYADLIATADARNLETARIIRGQYLAKT